MTIRGESLLDRLIGVVDTGLRTLVRDKSTTSIPPESDTKLSSDEKKKSASLMRINHAGEVCAQGLYEGQAWYLATTPYVVNFFRRHGTRGDTCNGAKSA